MVTYISDATAYHYLKPQRGGSVFKGTLRQRGKGLGGLLGSIAKTAFPIFKKFVLPHVKKGLISTAGDVIAGKNVKQSIKKRGKKTGKNIIRSLLKKPPTKKRKKITFKTKKRTFLICENG